MLQLLAVTYGPYYISKFLESQFGLALGIGVARNKLVPIITTAMFLGLYGTMAAPHFTNIANIPAVAAILVAGITSIFVNKFAANHKKLKEFAFPLSMIVGMLGACVANLFI